MIKQLKKLTVQMVAGANVVTVLLMLGTGYADRISPTAHPMLACGGMLFPVFLLLNLLFLFFWLTFKWRKMWIPIVGYALAYEPISIYLPLNTTRSIPEGTLKVISYNVCGYGGNFKYENSGFEVVRDYLRDEAPDIVCIQEDIDTWRRYVKQEYTKIFAYNDTALVSNLSCAPPNYVGIHTRFPILSREHIVYDSNANGSVAWMLDVDGDTVVVINNHFEHSHLTTNDRLMYKRMLRGKVARDTVRSESHHLASQLAEAAAKRAPQIDAVCRYIEAHSQYPIILCGDFNDTPISYARRQIGQRLTDCYVSTGRGLGLSYNQRGFNLRIDHIFCSSDIRPYNCKVDKKIDASDHYPMVCWLKIGLKP